MKILLTGACGFTGRHFRESAERQGHEVVSPVFELRDPAAIARELAAIDYTHVVHLAAISFAEHADPESLYQVNLLGTLHLLEALLSRGVSVERILLASSANIYGNASVPVIDETICPAPINHYATSKLAMEHMARAYANRLPIVFVRPFNYTGRGQDSAFIVPKLVECFRARASAVEVGNLEVEREFNDVRMVCEAYLRLLVSADIGCTYNICSGKGYALRDVLEQLGTLSAHRPAIRFTPKFVRSQEVHRLVGDPSRLQSAIGALPEYPLSETLQWMLDAEPSRNTHRMPATTGQHVKL